MPGVQVSVHFMYPCGQACTLANVHISFNKNEMSTYYEKLHALLNTTIIYLLEFENSKDGMMGKNNPNS